MKLLILGGGQLARMMHAASIALGLRIRLLAEGPDVSAAQVVADTSVGDYTDAETVYAFAERCDELRCAETTPVFGQRHGDRELDAVHAHADQRVQLDGERGVGVGRHAPIVSVVRGKERRDTMNNLYR